MIPHTHSHIGGSHSSEENKRENTVQVTERKTKRNENDAIVGTYSRVCFAAARIYECIEFPRENRFVSFSFSLPSSTIRISFNCGLELVPSNSGVNFVVVPIEHLNAKRKKEKRKKKQKTKQNEIKKRNKMREKMVQQPSSSSQAVEEVDAVGGGRKEKKMEKYGKKDDKMPAGNLINATRVKTNRKEKKKRKSK